MFRRACFVIGFALMGWAVVVIRAAHVQALRCSSTDVTKATNILSGSCTQSTWPYLQGFALLIGGALLIIMGLALGSSRSSNERKMERQYRKDLKAGKFTHDPSKVADMSAKGRLTLHHGYVERPESPPIPYEQRFLKPFDEPGSVALGEDATAEVAQADGEEHPEEGQ